MSQENTFGQVPFFMKTDFPLVLLLFELPSCPSHQQGSLDDLSLLRSDDKPVTSIDSSGFWIRPFKTNSLLEGGQF